MSRDLLRVHYGLRSPGGEREARERAEAVALEQTVEVPRAVADAAGVEHARGRVERLEPGGDGAWRAVVAYPVETTSFDPAQLVNVLFGNTSLHGDVQCVDAELPPSLLEALQGPCFGIEGLRKSLGAYGRPLTCTAVKPMGLSARALAELFGDFARAGIDVIKDDHGLADQSFCPFEERVEACQAMADRVARETGHRAIYAPNLIGPPGAVLSRLRFAESHGVGAVLTSPMLIGLPAFWELCQSRASVPVIAHPSFGGAGGLSPELLFGKLLRLLGADAVIFVSFGSRFAAGRERCRRIADTLRAPWGGLSPSLPVPAGGIAVEGAADVARFYGRDTMLLVGGDLQVEPGAVGRRSRAFVEAVRRS
jgi:ribulose-bisphosphate carboxylase large chain